MNQTEINRRNEAIALFDGWSAPSTVQPFPALYWKGGKVQHVHDFAYHTDWNALMPVVEKIRRSQYPTVSDATDGYGNFVVSDTNDTLYYYHVWDTDRGMTGGKVVESMQQAYFMAVSDYCLSLTAPTGE